MQIRALAFCKQFILLLYLPTFPNLGYTHARWIGLFTSLARTITYLMATEINYTLLGAIS